MKHIKVPTHFIKKNTDTLNTGNHAESAIQYKNQKRDVRIKSSILLVFWALTILGFFHLIYSSFVFQFLGSNLYESKCIVSLP